MALVLGALKAAMPTPTMARARHGGHHVTTSAQEGEQDHPQSCEYHAGGAEDAGRHAVAEAAGQGAQAGLHEGLSEHDPAGGLRGPPLDELEMDGREDGDAQQVGRLHPQGGGEAEVQQGPHLGKGHRHDGGVQGRHEGPHAGQGQQGPAVVAEVAFLHCG